MILNIILGIIGLGIVIVIHETGHFLAAKASGISVEAFSIFFRGRETRPNTGSVCSLSVDTVK